MKKNTLLRTNTVVCIIIVIGFILTSVISYRSNISMLEKDMEHVSTLTSEGIYYQIDSFFSKPVNVSLTMANDSLLKTFLNEELNHLGEEAYVQELQNYLMAYKEKYSYDSVFLVSAKTNRYYHFNGLDRILTPGYFENEWYFNFLNKNEEYSLNVDNDEASGNNITAFVNCAIKDMDGITLGVVGVGLRVDHLQQMLRDYDKRFDVRNYMINYDGVVQVSSMETGFENINLFENSGYTERKEEITKNIDDKTTFWYNSPDGRSGFVVARYIPSLRWYLLVESDTSELNQQMNNQITNAVIIIASIILLVLVTITSVIRKYNRQIMRLATHDSLTDIYNRIHYEKCMETCNGNLNSFKSLGIVLMDLNGLKRVNDRYGHHTGDEYIRNSCRLICGTFKDLEVFRIGGDEFTVLLKNMTPEEVEGMHQALLNSMERFNEGKEIKVSIAFGYSFYDKETDRSLEDTFLRADAAMYENKQAEKCSDRSALYK